jgi:hypothetical protein
MGAVELPPKHRQSLADIGIGVVTKEAGSAIAKWLPAPTELDKLAELAKLLLAPEETLAPKFLGILAEVIARHAGKPDFAAKWIGVLVEQAVRPLFEPEGVRGALLACLEDFTAISDLGNGQMTSAVVNVALDRLSDELKKRMEQQARVLRPATTQHDHRTLPRLFTFTGGQAIKTVQLAETSQHRVFKFARFLHAAQPPGHIVERVPGRGGGQEQGGQEVLGGGAPQVSAVLVGDGEDEVPGEPVRVLDSRQPGQGVPPPALRLPGDQLRVEQPHLPARVGRAE